MPLISIITITYNAEKELEPTLKSVRSQSFKDYEHIIVDGASADATLDVARRYGYRHVDSSSGGNVEDDVRLKIYSRPDSGIYHGMNRGLKYTSGDYILFLNAGDTFATSDTLSRYAEAADISKYDIIYGDTVIVDENGNILRPRHLSAPERLTVESFKKGMLVCHQAFMARRGIAPKYSHNYRLSADYDWCIRCMQATTPERSYNLKATVIHYLDNGASEKQKTASLKERFSIMSHHYGFIPTLLRHLSFIPRALKRRLSGSR